MARHFGFPHITFNLSHAEYPNLEIYRVYKRKLECPFKFKLTTTYFSHLTDLIT